MTSVEVFQECPFLYFDNKKACSWNGNSGDLLNCVVPGAEALIKVFKHIQESEQQLMKYL